MENPIKMDDLGVPLFLETPLYYQPKQCLALSYKGNPSKLPYIYIVWFPQNG